MVVLVRVAAAGFYIPLAPPLPHKISSRCFKISCDNYNRTGSVFGLPILKHRLFYCHRKLTVRRRTAPFRRQQSQKV